MKFADITGHNEEKRRLRQMAQSGKIPHALLLHGPSGIGKTAVARAFIQYLYCENPTDDDSCGRCPSCLQTSRLNNPDVHYVYPVVKNAKHPNGLSADYAEEWSRFLEENPYMSPRLWHDAIEAGNSRPIIYVDESEEILRISSLSSYGKGRKVFLVWQPEKMNLDTANKLLKVIEEPFPDTTFILVSNNAGAIMPTILSRLQGIPLKPLPETDVIDFFIKNGKSRQEAESLARIAAGNMNTASQIAGADNEMSQFTGLFIDVMRAAYARKMTELKSLSDTFSDFGREKSLRLLEYFARMIRESFISNLGVSNLQAMTREESDFVKRFGPFINEANVEEMQRETDMAREDISRNANQKVVWFDYLIQLTRLIRTNTPIKK